MTELPGYVARMWGRETGSRHGPRPSLDLDRITTAAVQIADAEGLAGVRMSSVASHMGVAAMTLYRYVGSKDELLMAMVDAATPEPPDTTGKPWRDYLAEWTRANRDLYFTRPWMLQIAHLAPPIGPRGLRWLDRAIAVLADTGLDSGEKINIASSLTGYASSQAALTIRLASGATTDPGGPLGYGNVLAEVLDSTEYPALSKAVEDGAFGEAEQWIEDADFVFGLNLLLDGVEALISRRLEN